jgi:hypothetical protein
MKTRAYAVILVAIILTVLRVSGAVAIGQQEKGGTPQSSKPSQGKMPHHPPGTMGMDKSAMMQEPHHVLAMAYKDNLVNFAKVLHHEANQTKPINPGFARAAVAEMRRSYDQMLEHHRDHMKAMDEQMKSRMADMMKQMDAHHAGVGEHLTALEKVVHAAAPDAKGISEHVAEILKQCDGMAKMHGGAMGHKMAGPKDDKMN